MQRLSDLVGREDTTLEERSETAERMIHLAKLLNEIDKRNKDFRLKVLGIGSVTLLGLVAMAATALGVNVKALESAADGAEDVILADIVFHFLALRWFLWERFRHRPSSAGENNDLTNAREGPFPRHPP